MATEHYFLFVPILCILFESALIYFNRVTVNSFPSSRKNTPVS
jgi:hypothetical protein